jgi:hypothetical protein
MHLSLAGPDNLFFEFGWSITVAGSLKQALRHHIAGHHLSFDGEAPRMLGKQCQFARCQNLLA